MLVYSAFALVSRLWPPHARGTPDFGASVVSRPSANRRNSFPSTTTSNCRIVDCFYTPLTGWVMIQSTLLLLPLLALIQSATSNTNLAPREHDRIIQRLSPFPNSTFSPSLSANDSSLMASTLSSSALLNFNSQLNILAECPPCSPFNCVLPAFTCLNSGKFPCCRRRTSQRLTDPARDVPSEM